MFMSIKNVQRLSRNGVGHKLMMLEAVSTLPSNVEGKDIVWAIWKHIDAGKAAGMVLRTILNNPWGEYAQYFKRLMSEYAANSSKRIIIIGHTSDIITDDGILETMVKVKGSIMDRGVEAAFTTVVAVKVLPLKDLKDYENDLLTITEDDEINGYKHVFQTMKTKKTTGDRIRGPMGMWERNETFIDNDIDLVLKRIESYFAE